MIVMESVLPNLINLQSENDGVKSLLGLCLNMVMLAYNQEVPRNAHYMNSNNLLMLLVLQAWL